MNILNKLNPSYLTQNALETTRRFPFVILSALLTGIFFEIYIVDAAPIKFSALLTSSIGISAFLSLRLYLERSSRPKLFWPLHGALLILLGITYWLNPDDITSSGIRLLQILAAVHLLVAIVPFINDHKANSFWFYNQGIFVRFFISSVYTGVLLAGLMIILGTLHYLFHIDTPELIYRYVAIFCIFFFHPLHFLNGIPKNFDDLQFKTEYPKSVRVFSQYLLIPLVCIYGVILITYCVTLVGVQQWPKGVISSMIIGYSIVGILTQLMIAPLMTPENLWALRFSRLVNLSLAILSLVIFAAVYRRMSEYGMTESRYFLVITGIWLISISLYLILGKKRDIRFVPITLFLVTFFTAFGPWGAYSVSLRLQMARLEKILEKNKVLNQGQLTKDHPEVSWNDRDDVTGIISYVVNRHGTSTVRKLFPEKTFPVTNIISVESFMGAMALEPTSQNQHENKGFEIDKELELSVGGAKNIRTLSTRYSHSKEKGEWELVLDETHFSLRYKGKIVFKETHDSIIKSVGAAEATISGAKPTPLSFNFEGNKATLHFSMLNGQFTFNKKPGRIFSFSAILLY